MNLLTEKRFNVHICGAYLKFATEEHLDAVKSQATKAGATFCNMQFPKNSYSDSNYGKKTIFGSKTLNSKHRFIKHFEKMDSAALFIQEPYIENYPDWFSSLATEVNLAYAGYSLNLVDYFPGQYGSSLIKNSKYLLAGSHNEYIGYQKCSSQKSNVLLSGNPLMFKLREQIQLMGTKKHNHNILLWAPHWIQEWEDSKNGFARWEIALNVIHKFVVKNPECLLILRPHPILRIAIQGYLNPRHKIVSNEVRKTQDTNSFKDLLSRFAQLIRLPNVNMSSASMIEDVLRADYLITEGISIIGYWATTGKPIAVLRDQNSPTFNEDGSNLLSAMEQIGDADLLSEWLKLNFKKEQTRNNDDMVEISRIVHPTFQDSPLELLLKTL